MIATRKVSATAFDDLKQPQPRELTPAQGARVEHEQQLDRLMAQLGSAEDVYAVTRSDGEKPTTLRVARERAARASGKDVVIRKHGEGLLVGLSTPERERARRGQRPKREVWVPSARGG